MFILYSYHTFFHHSERWILKPGATWAIFCHLPGLELRAGPVSSVHFGQLTFQDWARLVQWIRLGKSSPESLTVPVGKFP